MLMKTPNISTPVMSQFDQEFEKFLEDLRGYVWNDQKKTHRSWDTLARDANLSYTTVRNFAMGDTKRPHFGTIFKLMKALDVRFGFFPAGTPLKRGEIDITKYHGIKG